MDEYKKYLEGNYDGPASQRGKQIQEDVFQATQTLEEIEQKQEENWEAEKDRISEEYGTQDVRIDDLINSYNKENKYGEYLVDGATLTCTQAVIDDFKFETDGAEITVVLDKTVVLPEEDKKRRQTRLCVSENSMTINGRAYATVMDTVKEQNIFPFRCNCLQPADRENEKKKIMDNLSDCQKNGVCQYLMQLNEEWDNMPLENGSYLVKTDVREEYFSAGAGNVFDSGSVYTTSREAEGITMTSVLFCKHGGLIYLVTSGQSIMVMDNISEDTENGLPITMKQMEAFGFEIDQEGLDLLNSLQELHGVTDKISIALFMATCGHESGKGTILLEEGDEAYFRT